MKEEIAAIEDLKKELQDLQDLYSLGEIDKKAVDILEKKIKKEEFKTFLSGKYDKGSAIMEIYSGAGGVDAQDWATLLLRMFERYCQKKGFQVKVLHQSFGEGGGPEGRIGTKSATLEIKGPYAYGFLRGESGVHRLVRISPFSSQKLRHTSFALIEVIPEIGRADQKEIEIKPDDLKVDTFRASGPGGQNVNRRESAIRITHIPTGITVSSQAERSQLQNREKAMEILYSKLYRLKEAERKEKIKEIRGEAVSASWGNQIRSYVLHPYKQVKDLRTGLESKDPDKVLDGELDEFIEAEIKL